MVVRRNHYISSSEWGISCRVTGLGFGLMSWLTGDNDAVGMARAAGRPDFPGPVGSLGLSMVSLPIRDKGQALVRIRPNTHGLLTTSCHLLRRLFTALCPGTALTIAPPSTQKVAGFSPRF